MRLDWLTYQLLVNALGLVTALALLFRARVRPAFVWSIVLFLGALFCTSVLLVFPVPEFGFDYRIFWSVGRDVWVGLDPYAKERFGGHPFLQPPSALPLFFLFATLPFGISCAIWTTFNILGCLALIPLAQRALLAQAQAGDRVSEEKSVSWKLPAVVLAGLTATLAVSDASFTTLCTGQLSIFAALSLVAALDAHARGRSVWAGLWLALASVKIGTMLPFLLLFLHKSAWRVWITLGIAILGLCLLTTRPTELLTRCVELLARIDEMQSRGQPNDYSFEGPLHETILGFEHAFYRLGLRDRQMVRWAQYLALLILGLWVARQVLPARVMPRAAACSLVALYSCLFLYHRRYDTVVLVLPLVYSVGRARAATNPTRWLFAGIALAILAVWYLKEGPLQSMYRLSQHGGISGWLIQAMALPYATWLLVLAMILLVIATRKSVSPSGGG